MKTETGASAAATRPLIGVSTLMRLAYADADLSTIWNSLVARTSADASDAAAWMDISVLLQARGEREKALQIQAAATALQPVFRRVFGDGSAAGIVAFVTTGDMMANTPVEFLLEGSNATLFYVYVDTTTTSLPDFPNADAAFLAVGQSAENAALLAHLEPLLAAWNGPPVFNGAPERIARLTRDGVHGLLRGVASIHSPQNIPVERPLLSALADGSADLEVILPGADYPLVLRPAETHAGAGMETVAGRRELGSYLRRHAGDRFYLAPFVDYRSPDGLFRKQRIVFIRGRAFASHFAVSEHWMVHYLSAGMREDAGRRDEEARWMADFDDDFARRHASAFEALTRRIGLDYFGIDCAEMPDGRLLVFEVDVAMIVHDMDSEEIFPYKKPAMRKLFKAFQEALLLEKGIGRQDRPSEKIVSTQQDRA